jgi:hypothetical protein
MRGASSIRNEKFADFFCWANLLRTDQQPFSMLSKNCRLGTSFKFRHYLSFASNGGRTAVLARVEDKIGSIREATSLKILDFVNFALQCVASSI